MQFLELCASDPVVRFPAGTPLIVEGGEERKLFVLRRGSVLVTKGGVMIAQVDQPGALFGEMSALLDVPYTATVTAQKDSEAHEIADATAFLTEQPDLALDVAKLLAKRLYDANRYVAERPDRNGAVEPLWGLIYQQPAAG